jgi:hypothetical protein
MTGQLVRPDAISAHGHCIVGCGEDGPPNGDPNHGPYCERSVGSKANAVTEPSWVRTQFWCSVISPYMHGEYPTPFYDDCQKYRDGVQLTASVQGEIAVEPQQPGWQDLKFNLTPGEARQLAAQLVAAANSNDGIDQSPHLNWRLDKIADRLDMNLYR